MKKIVKYLVIFYQITLSKTLLLIFGGGCRFSPTCSEYSKTSFQKFGLIKGFKLTFLRLIRCHPFSKSFGYDPVP
jgi:putative membrane protein insertion efficiency factor